MFISQNTFAQLFGSGTPPVVTGGAERSTSLLRKGEEKPWAQIMREGLEAAGIKAFGIFRETDTGKRLETKATQIAVNKAVTTVATNPWIWVLGAAIIFWVGISFAKR